MLSGFTTALMMMHFLTTLKKHAITGSHMPAHSSPRINANLAWWLLLPIAWFGPFMPGSIQFEAKSLLLVVMAFALFFYIRQGWSRPPTQAPVFQPGDIYHLFTYIRLSSPVLVKRKHNQPALFTWPQHATSKLSSNQSLTVPGLLWFSVFTLLIISLLIAS